MTQTTNAPPSQSDRPVAPTPPRYWWLKRVTIAGLVLTIGVIALHLWWAGYAERRVAQVIADAQAAGEPILPEDFNPPFVPTENNAAFLYLRAAELVHGNKELNELVNRPAGLIHVDANELDAIVETLAAYEEVFVLLREARFQKHIVWPIEYSRPLMSQMLPDLADLRNCAKLLALQSTIERNLGATQETLANVSDLLAFSDAMSHDSTLIRHLVALTLQRTAVESLEALLPWSGHGVIAAADSTAGAVYDAELRDELIRVLLNEGPLAEGFFRSICMERALQIDTIAALFSGDPAIQLADGPPDRLMHAAPSQPVMRMASVRLAEYMACYVDAARKPTWPEHLDRLHDCSEPPIDQTGFGAPTAWLASMLLPSLSRACNEHYKAITFRRLAAVGLALRMFELGHGRRAKTLDELVSAGYLDAVPHDPFAREGVLQYAPDLEKPLVYSIGPNCTDDGGEYVMNARGTVSTDAGDIVFFMDGQRPRESTP